VLDASRENRFCAMERVGDVHTSQYDLEVSEIKREANSGTVGELDTLDTPMVFSSDEAVEVFYSLIENDLDRLSPIDGEQQLVFAFGEDEQLVTFGSDQTMRFENIEQLAYLNPEDYVSLRLIANNDAGNILWEYAFNTPKPLTLTRQYSLANYDSVPLGQVDIIGSFRVVDIPLLTPSIVRVDLLDHNQQQERNFVNNQLLEGNHKLVVTRSDLDSLLPRDGIDFFIRVTSTPANGKPETTRFYEGHLNDVTSGLMLGQIIQHDTLVQRGALTLRREDLALKGVGPQLNFIRSYANEAYPENDKTVMGPGWTHNHNIFIQIAATRDVAPVYGDNLPRWVEDTRSPTGPIAITAETLAQLQPSPDEIGPVNIVVSNGGTFRRASPDSTEWEAQRGHHGTLTYEATAAGVVPEEEYWLYRSKDGTKYKFESPGVGRRKGYVESIEDRNGNQLLYEYQTLESQRLVTRILDQTNREMLFNYESVMGNLRLTSVVEQVDESAAPDIELTFEYDELDANAPLIRFARDDFEEEYQYHREVDDDAANLTHVIDANIHVTEYRYLASDDVPGALANYVPNLKIHDVVDEIHYPSVPLSAGETNFAKIIYNVESANNRVVTDLRGFDTNYELNDFGNPLRIDEPEGKSTTFAWSAEMGEPDNVMRRKTDESIGATWEYEYDALGNLTREVDPFGKVTTQLWDQSFSVLLSRIDKNQNTFEQTLDDHGNVRFERQSATVGDTEQIVVTEHAYGQSGSGYGLRLSTKDGREFTTTYGYDDFGNINLINEPEGSTTEYLNDDRGLRQTETDPSGNVTAYEYDSLDRLLLLTDGEGNTDRYEYDNKGNKTLEEMINSYLVDSTTHSRTVSLTYDYDGRDRVTNIDRSGSLNGAYPIGGSKSFTYDGNSNLLTETDWKGVVTTHTYDGLNRSLVTNNRDSDPMSYAYEFVSNVGLKKTNTDYEGRVSYEHQDLLGRLVRIEHPTVFNIDGASANYDRVIAYDNLENVTSITDENNHTTGYEYDGRYLKIRQNNPASDDYHWQYDAAGNLVATIDEESSTTTFVYDKQNRLTDKNTPENQSWSYAYFDNGTVREETDPWGFTYSYTYNGINQRTSVTHPDGTDLEEYTNDGQLVFRKDAENRTSTRLIGPEGRIHLETDARGRATTNVYDDNNNVTTTTLAWAQTETGPSVTVSEFGYDVLDRVISATEAQGAAEQRTTGYSYDKQSNRLAEIQPEGRETSYEYDELNRAKLITSAVVGGLNPETKQIFDGVGNLVSITDRRDKTTTTMYDVLDRPDTVTDPDGFTVDYGYDKVGNVLTAKDKRGNITTTTYDKLYRVEDVFVNKDTNGFRLAFNEYDLKMGSGQRQNATTDANNNRVRSDIDWRGNVTVTTLPVASTTSGSGTGTVVNGYDNSGFMLSTTDANSLETQYTYFGDGSVATVSNAEAETTSFQYDLFGNQVRVSKPKGSAYLQTSTYDARNRLVSVDDALNNTTRFVYDVNSNLTDQFQPAANDSGEVHVQYDYDALNRKIAHIQHKSDGNLTSTYTYDAEGNMLTATDANSKTFTYSYDNLNRLDITTYPANDDINVIDNDYDANGNVVSITESKPTGSEVTGFSYDLLDRMLTRDQRGHLVSYGYDNNGNRLNVTAPGGVTTHTYDTRNRLATTTAGNSTTSYEYKDNGWLLKVNHGNNTAVNYDYFNDGVVSGITNTLADNSVVSQFAYLYDDNNNRTQQIETQNGFADAQVVTTDYSYDVLDRLEGYTEVANDSTYSASHAYTFYPSYDRKTEIVSVDGVEEKNRTLTYDQTYWLTSISETAGTGGSITYSYDGNGNTTSKTDTTGQGPASTVFNYNFRNQLKSVASGAVGTEVGQGSHDYNYAGMRIRHLGSERGDIEYIYDDQSIIDEVVNSTSTQVAHYRYGDRLLSLDTDAGEQFYHYASLGTTANLSDSAGEMQVAYRVDAYGEITRQEGVSVNRQVFTGQEHDEKTGLIYFGARFYDPDVGRFINQDSYLGESGTPPSLHRYLYAYGNPTVYVDRNGNFSLDAHVEMTKEAIKQAESSGNFNVPSTKFFRTNVEIGSMYPDVDALSYGFRAKQKVDFNIKVPGADYVKEKAHNLSEAIKEKVMPDLNKLGKTVTEWWQDSDSIGPAVEKIEEVQPGFKDNKLVQSHYGEGQWQHGMGTNTEEVVNNMVEQSVERAKEYWGLTTEGKNNEAAVKLGTALHYVQDSYSASHMYRDEQGRIQKSYDYNLQSGHLHSHDDNVKADHSTRQAAVGSSAEYLRLVQKYKGDPEGLTKSLQNGIFSTNIDESIETPRQKRANLSDIRESATQYIDKKKNSNHDE
jgi:RHS repeat-associated protein